VAAATSPLLPPSLPSSPSPPLPSFPSPRPDGGVAGAASTLPLVPLPQNDDAAAGPPPPPSAPPLPRGAAVVNPGQRDRPGMADSERGPEYGPSPRPPRLRAFAFLSTNCQESGQATRCQFGARAASKVKTVSPGSPAAPCPGRQVIEEGTGGGRYEEEGAAAAVV
jgi:hypothetical protein